MAQERWSEMAFASPSVVDSAPRAALRFGLFSILEPRPEGDGRWQSGVEWETLGCGPASGIGDPDCIPSGNGPTSAIGLPKFFSNDGVPLGEASAFSVYSTFLCGPVGRGLAQAQERARQSLLAREETRVEQALWTGDLGNVPNLQDSSEDINSGGALDAVEAIGALEQFLAQNYGSLGVIHMSRAAAITGLAALALESSGSRLTTALGTPVVAGGGYPGSSPDGEAAATGESWAMASPALFGFRSDVFVPSSRQGDLMDRGTNDLFAIAERSYLLGFDDCGVGAVRLTLGCC